jgi:hypothetical protein
MYSANAQECARAHIADLHRQAQRDAQARAARRDRRAHTRQATPHVRRHPAFGRGVLGIFRTRTT